MKILIWGTGQLSWHVIRNFNKQDIIGYIDSFRKHAVFAGRPVYLPKDISGLDYDAVVVAIQETGEIVRAISKWKIPQNKCIFAYGSIVMEDLNQDYDFVREICGEKYADCIRHRYHVIKAIDSDINREQKHFEIKDYIGSTLYKNDYVRLKTFELLSGEIYAGKVRGNVAELGVYRGEFARFVNAAFRDRLCYLFDTFEGFEETELKKETTGNIRWAVRDIYQNTSVDIVMEKMEYPEKVVIKKGFFPESVVGLEDEFAFVSLDCDWEESLYQGLKYFYPRLSAGGYIMLHDYNNFLTCARKAVSRYEADEGIRLYKVPVCDNQGSLVIAK